MRLSISEQISQIIQTIIKRGLVRNDQYNRPNQLIILFWDNRNMGLALFAQKCGPDAHQVSETIHNASYQDLIERLVQARIDAGLTQAQIADSLGKHQSFIVKIDGLERRIDVFEFFQISKAIGVDPLPMLRETWQEVRAE